MPIRSSGVLLLGGRLYFTMTKILSFQHLSSELKAAKGKNLGFFLVCFQAIENPGSLQ